MAADILAAATGRHDALPAPVSDAEHYSRFREWWKTLVRESTTAKRAPPPAEDEIDFLVYGLLTVLFVLAVW